MNAIETVCNPNGSIGFMQWGRRGALERMELWFSAGQGLGGLASLRGSKSDDKLLPKNWLV